MTTWEKKKPHLCQEAILTKHSSAHNIQHGDIWFQDDTSQNGLQLWTQLQKDLLHFFMHA